VTAVKAKAVVASSKPSKSKPGGKRSSATKAAKGKGPMFPMAAKTPSKSAATSAVVQRQATIGKARRTVRDVDPAGSGAASAGAASEAAAALVQDPHGRKRSGSDSASEDNGKKLKPASTCAYQVCLDKTADPTAGLTPCHVDNCDAMLHHFCMSHAFSHICEHPRYSGARLCPRCAKSLDITLTPV
jgi:hypothetical protein